MSSKIIFVTLFSHYIYFCYFTAISGFENNVHFYAFIMNNNDIYKLLRTKFKLRHLVETKLAVTFQIALC